MSAEGVDLNANYLIGLGDAGYLATDLMGIVHAGERSAGRDLRFRLRRLLRRDVRPAACRWRHRFRATWETDFRLNLSLAWRYLGGVEIDAASPNPYLGNPDDMEFWRINGSDKVRPYNWFDLAASYTFRNGIKLTLGRQQHLRRGTTAPAGPGRQSRYINLYANYDPLGTVHLLERAVQFLAKRCFVSVVGRAWVRRRLGLGPASESWNELWRHTKSEGPDVGDPGLTVQRQTSLQRL